MPSRLTEFVLVVVLLAGTFLFAAATDPGMVETPPVEADSSPLDHPRLVIDRRAGKLLLKGTSVSARNDAILLQTARDRFAGIEIEADFRAGVIVPDYWQASSLHLLSVLAATESAVAVLEPGQASVRGVTSDAASLRRQLTALEDIMPDGSRIIEDVAIVDLSASLEELCSRSFAHAMTEPVAFRLSSAELRTSSYALLDKIVEAANDCRGGRIAITGHTDSSGNEAWNRELSRARAQAVADYLVHAGIQAQRLIVEGMGSAVPVADNDTALGRSRNRRIEFEFRQAPPEPASD